MTKRGTAFVADPALGICTRDDLDRLCHVELDEEVNTYLARFSNSGLQLVAVNPDGERHASRDRLCFWYPKLRALELKGRLVNPEMGSEEAKFREHYRWLKDYRVAAYSCIKKQEAQLEKVTREEAEAVARQQEFEWAQMKKGC